MRKFVFIINLLAVFMSILLLSCKKEQAETTSNSQTAESIKQLVDSVQPSIDSSRQVLKNSEPQKEKEASLTVNTESNVKSQIKAKETSDKKMVNKSAQESLPCFDYEVTNYDTTKYILIRHSSKQWCLSDRLIFYLEPKSYNKANYELRHIANKWYLVPKTDGKLHNHKTEIVNDTLRLINGNGKIGGRKE